MPVSSIITQPATDSLNAAYRPIIIRAEVTRTDADPVPPVVFCDIYFAGIYYKTMSRTQYAQLNSLTSEFQFDIQDAAQEYLRSQTPVNGGAVFIAPTSPLTECFCRVRSSGFDVDGFLVPEDTAPVQGTGSSDPVAGTGTETNTFTILNATLQHEDNQVFETHLNSFKEGTWDADALPLTHRPPVYKICPGDSDYYPFFDKETREYCIKLFYKLKGESGYTELESCYCTPPTIPAISLPGGNPSLPYEYSFVVTGSTPLSIDVTDKPAWMTIAAVGSVVTLSGTPLVNGAVDVIFTISNACGEVVVNEELVISDCEAPVISGDPLPDAVQDEPYSYDIDITGSTPFSIGSIVKPAWMTVSLVGSTVSLTGTPTATATDVEVSFEITNCSVTPVAFSDTIDVIATPGWFKATNDHPTAIITSVSPAFFLIDSGAFPVNPTEEAGGTHGIHSGTIDVGVTDTEVAGGNIEFRINLSTVQTVPFSGTDTYTIPSVSFNTGDNVQVYLTI